MVSVDEALASLADAIPALDAETVPLSDARSRVAAEDVVSPVDLPPFAQSAMDGYAVRAADTSGASEASPATLEIVGEVAAGGGAESLVLDAGEACRISTGARVPEGADTVVRQERARREGDTLFLERTFEMGKDVRPVGEELERGTPLISAGERLDERHVAALSMTGHSEIAVRRRPRIALLVSGDEVVPPGEELGPGEIYDANTPLLRGMLERLGYDDLNIEHLADESSGVLRRLERALAECDLVVSTGGVSVGDHDFLGQSADELGAERVFWGVDQKPGRPVYFAVRDDTPFVGLPGNPGAVYVDAYVYLTRVLDALEGVATCRPHFRAGRLEAPIERSSRLRWSPCGATVDAEATVELDPIDGGRAHRLGQLFRADGLARIPAGDGEVPAGRAVEWVPTPH